MYENTSVKTILYGNVRHHGRAPITEGLICMEEGK